MADIESSHLENLNGPPLAKKIPNGAAKSCNDYASIFGGLPISFSIPVLDLPPAINGCDSPIDVRSSGFDYSEIFGGFQGGGDFALSYEELLAESKRVSEETGSDKQVTEVSELPSEGPNGDHVPHSEKDETSNSHNSYFVSGKHNMPYHKSRQGSKVDTTNGPMHATKPPVFPVSTFVVEACSSSQNIKADNPPNMVTNDLSLSGDLKGEREEGKQGKLLIHTSYGCTEGFENDLKDDHKQFATEYAGPEDVKHHSRSSSYHSTSSGDISYPDSFVTVSDISLRTQPLRITPPSRPPPELDLKQGDPKMKISPISEPYLDEVSFHKPKIKHQNYGGGVYKHQAIQETMKDNSPHFFDVESEASSAAAASAAAMKEAMEQAQARLKSAKESMERKRDNHQIRKRLGHHDVVKCEERKEESQEVRNFSAEITQKTMEKDRPINDFFVEERQKTMKASKVALGCKEKATYLVLTEEAQQMVQGKESRLSQVSSKLEEKNDEWKVDGQFYELINKEKFKMVQEVPDHENFEKKFSATIRTDEEKEKETKVPKLAHDLETVQELSEWEYSANQLNAASMADNIKENESKEAKMALEYKRNGKLYSVNESCQWNGNACKLNSGIVAGREEEIKKILEAIPEFCVQEENENEQKGASVVSIPRQTENEQKGAPVVCVPKKNENKLEGALDFGQQDGNENKLKVNQETHVCAEEEKNSNAAKDAHVCRDEDKKLKASDEACKFEEVHGSEEKKQVAGKETLQCIQIGEELNATYVAFECKKNEKKLELVNEVGRLDANEREVNLFNGSREYELRENMKAAQEATQCEKLEKTRGTINLSCDHEVKNVCKLKGISVTLDQEESKNFNGTRKACDLMKDERTIKLTQEALELEENEMKLKASQEVLQVTVNRKKMKAEKEACQQNCNEKKAREAQLEHQQNENKLKASQVPCRLENSENKLTADEGEQGHREIDIIMEVQVCQGVKSRDFEAVLQAMLLEEEGNILSSSLDASESCIIRKKENTTANMHKEDERGNEERTEREKKPELEQARKLEEEKEREREREKDRLAVEKTSHEAHERAFAESWERAERIAVERVTAEARQRSLAEAQERGEKAPVEAMGNSLAAKASREAKLRAERAAVERATAEARERAVERALAEKANLEARERVERSAAISKDRMRKDNEADGYFRPSDKEDSGMLRPSDVLNALHDAKFRGGESALRCKARLERHQRTVERAAKALAEKKMRDILAQREQAERNRLAESLDADVRRWSNGKEGNLRALLSTLQYILGPESGWQPIPLTDVITAAAVKKAYRKATLSVHPDKLQQRGASIRHKYICEKVFDLLKDAWNRFNSEER